LAFYKGSSDIIKKNIPPSNDGGRPTWSAGRKRRVFFTGEPVNQTHALTGSVPKAVDARIGEIVGSQHAAEATFQATDAQHALDTLHDAEPQLGFDEVKLLHLAGVFTAVFTEEALATTSRLTCHNSSSKKQ